MADKQVIIIGLDGGTYRIIDPLLRKNRLPNISKIIGNGTRTILNSTIPALTPPAWVTMMTGKSPGRHGIFNFFKYDINNCDYSQNVTSSKAFFDSSFYKGQTLWDILGNADHKVCAILVPMTFPSWRINGYMISGFPTPDFNNLSTYPKDWGKTLGQLIDMSAVTFDNEDQLIAECKKLVRKTTEILLDKIENGKCDVYATVFSSIDFVQHHLWKYLDSTDSRFAEAINEMYEEVDEAIGQILSHCKDEASVFLLSDHGFCAAPKYYFNTNSWLNQEGYLSLLKGRKSAKLGNIFIDQLKVRTKSVRLFIKKRLSRLPKAVQKKAYAAYFKTNRIDWSNTRAFRYKMSLHCDGVVINRKGRQDKGVIENDEDYEKTRNLIIRDLQALKDPRSNETVCLGVHKREDLYEGDFVGNLPDIIIRLRPDFQPGTEVDGPVFSYQESQQKSLSGSHETEGIIIMGGPSINKSSSLEPIEMRDVTPTILFSLGLPIPEDMDGRPVLEAFREPLRSQPITGSKIKTPGDTKETEISERDHAEIEKSLRGLGYLD